MLRIKSSTNPLLKSADDVLNKIDLDAIFYNAYIPVQFAPLSGLIAKTVDLTVSVDGSKGPLPVISASFGPESAVAQRNSRPELAISVSAPTVKNGGATLVTFTFDRVVTSFEESDIVLSKGLALVAGSFKIDATNPQIYTAQIIAKADKSVSTETIEVKESTYFDVFVNRGQAAKASVQINSDTVVVKNGANLQAVIDNAAEGAIIMVESGSYTGNLTISKAITLIGANASKQGYQTARVQESIIKGEVKITASNVVIDGFTLTKQDTSVATDSAGNHFKDWTGLSVDVTSTASNVAVKNNVVNVYGAAGGFSSFGFVRIAGQDSVFSGNVVQAGQGYNIEKDPRGVSTIQLETASGIKITDNHFTAGASGNAVRMNGGSGVIDGNKVFGKVAGGFGIFGEYGDLQVTDNEVANLPSSGLHIVGSGKPATEKTIWIEDNEFMGDKQITLDPSQFNRYKGSEAGEAAALTPAKLDELIAENPGFKSIVLRQEIAGENRDFNFNNVLTKIVKYGASVDNTLSGTDQKDYLLGNDGNDTLIAGSGVDVLNGGSGADRFVFTSSDLDNTTVLLESATAVIEDFKGLSSGGQDVVQGSFGKGTAANYREGTKSYETLDDLVIAANAALNGTVKYFVGDLLTGGAYLVSDNDGVGYTELIQLVFGSTEKFSQNDIV